MKYLVKLINQLADKLIKVMFHTTSQIDER